MTEFAKPIKGRETPWGTAQQVKAIAPGIAWCSTASHGGYWLSGQPPRPKGRSLRDRARLTRGENDVAIHLSTSRAGR